MLIGEVILQEEVNGIRLNLVGVRVTMLQSVVVSIDVNSGRMASEHYA